MYKPKRKTQGYGRLRSIVGVLRRHYYDSIIYMLFITFLCAIIFIQVYEIKIFNGTESEIRLFMISGAGLVGLIFTIVLAVTLMAFQTVSEKYIPTLIWKLMNFPMFLYFGFCVALAVICVFFSANLPLESINVVDSITLLLILQIILTFPYMLLLFHMLKKNNIILTLEEKREINSLKELAFIAHNNLDIELEGDIVVSLARISESGSQYSEMAFKSLRDVSRLSLDDIRTFNFLYLVLEIRLNNAIRTMDIESGRCIVKILGLLCYDSIEETNSLQICSRVFRCFNENGLLSLYILPTDREPLANICRWLCEIINSAVRNSIGSVYLNGIIILLSLCGNASDQSDIMLIVNHLIEFRNEIMQMSEDILLESIPSDMDCNSVLLGFRRFKDAISKDNNV